ncbi:MAG: hypothetical protein PHN79_09515 [Methanoregula sp.]|nr:hypothetical protein [Methanoregula sp.]
MECLDGRKEDAGTRPGADFNNNGRVDVGDASKIAWYIVGKITEL